MSATHTYYIKGVYCNKCIHKIREALGNSLNIVELHKITGRFVVSTTQSYEEIKKQVGSITTGNFTLQRRPPYLYIIQQIFIKYRPIIVGLTLVLVLSFILQGSVWRNFMGLYFIVFGSLKVISLRGFVSMYREYDIIARRSKLFAYAYPFIELGFGVWYFTNHHSVLLNSIVFVLMLVKAYGVWNVISQKQEVKCACLGASFSVPISYVTLFEDLLMAGMALYMLV